MARRHMEQYGTTIRDFAEIAVTIRHHATLNERAIMRKPITIEDHHASRMISDPFRLLDCSQENDGGAAVVVSHPDAARELARPRILISGAEIVSGGGGQPQVEEPVGGVRLVGRLP